MANSASQNVVAQGRLVWVLGDNLLKGKVKLHQQTKQPMLDPKTNAPIVEYGFGLAIPIQSLSQDKLGPNLPGHIYAAMYQEALSLYPGGLPRDFAWKIKKGDEDRDEKNVPYSTRTGYAGHWVFTCVTRIPPKLFTHNGAYLQVSEGIDCGDYVTVQVAVKAHSVEGSNKAGIYLNPSLVLLAQKGERIVSTGQSPDSAFGMTAPVLHAGFGPTVAPTSPQNFAQFGQGQMQQPQQMPGMMPQQPMMQAPVQPNFEVLPQVHQQQFQQTMPQMGGVVNTPYQMPQQPMVPQMGNVQPMGGMPAYPATNQVMVPNGAMNVAPTFQQPMMQVNNGMQVPQMQMAPVPGMPMPGYPQQ